MDLNYDVINKSDMSSITDFLTSNGFEGLNETQSKIIYCIFNVDKFEEEDRNIINSDKFKALMFSNNLVKSFRLLSDKEMDENGNWSKKYLTNFVCEFYGNKGCSTYGYKISQGLIRVAATRIFSDPEQSIMELPVNSIDAYNSLIGKEPVGKFGMGFFSILFWISSSINGEYKRKLILESSHNNEEFTATLTWKTKGLFIEKTNILSEEFKKLRGDKNGFKITIDCKDHELDEATLNNMYKYIDRLKFIHGGDIYLKKELNEEYKKVNITSPITNNYVLLTINKSIIVVEDFATGVSYETLENSLLVPSSSTKARDTSKQPFIQPIFGANSTNSNLYILINDVINAHITLDVPFADFIIKMPFNTKLPVSRDDIIYTKYEISHFSNACIHIINNITQYGDLYVFFSLLKKYVLANKSNLLSSTFKAIRSNIENSPYYLIPKNDIWIKIKNIIPEQNRMLFLTYDEPNMYKLQNQISPILDHISNLNIFKLRKIIFLPINELSNNAGLSEYLFIKNTYSSNNDIASLSLKETNTLLIPYNESYDVEPFNEDFKEKNIIMQHRTFSGSFYGRFPQYNFFTNDVKNGLLKSYEKIKQTPELLLNVKLAKMIMKRKFSNIDNPYPFEDLISFYACYLLYLYEFHGKNYNEVQPRIVSLANSISDIKIKSTYGNGTIFDISNSFLILNPLISYFHQMENAKIDIEVSFKCLLESCLLFERLQKDETKFYTKKMLNPVTIIIPFINSNIFTPFLYEDIIQGIKNCKSSEEIYILIKVMNLVKKTLESELASYSDNTSNYNISDYLLDELRKKVSNDTLFKLISSYEYSENYDLINTIITYLEMYVINYLRGCISQKKKDINISQTEQKYVFSSKALIEYVFNNNGNFGFREISEYYKTYIPKEKKIQILEIAVNDGTSKDFIQSILTELLQNSTDAIRTTKDSNKKVDVYISDKSIEVKDYVGFENLINIMVPFLSSKNPNDPNVTGEMGSGFFNVYRQPFTKLVNIETNFNGRTQNMICQPVLEGENVIDIIYTIEEKTTTLPNYTRIVVLFNNNLKITSKLIADAHLFCKNYLSFIPDIILHVNTDIVSKNNKKTFENANMKSYFIDDPITKSYIMTNGIPFMSMQDFLISFINGKFDYDKIYQDEIKDDDYKNKYFSLVKTFSIFCSNGMIIDINKSIYTPTQARNKITLKGITDDEFIENLNSCMFNTMLHMYISEKFTYKHELMILNTDSQCSIGQLRISNVETIPYFFVNHQINVIYDDSRYNSIRDIINSYISSNVLFNYTDTMIANVVTKWFSNKKVEKKFEENDFNSQNGGGNNDRPKEEFTPVPILKKFIDIYWRLLNKNIQNGRIKSSKFNFTTMAPSIFTATEQPSSLYGFYKPNEHKLILNKNYYDISSLEAELQKFKGKEIILNATSFMMNDVLKKYFSPCIPCVTLIHELGHAIDNISHANSSHGITKIKVDNSDFLEFDDMCSKIYCLLIGDGLLTEFLSVI